MQKLYFILLLFVASLLCGCAGQPAAAKSSEEKQIPTSAPTASAPMVIAQGTSIVVPANCPITTPENPEFTPPAPYSDLNIKGHFWYGSSSLWTSVPKEGMWSNLPHNPEGYTQKVFWWRDGYSWTEEPEPDLQVSGERLDGKAPPLNVSKATNAYAESIGSAMLVGVDFPTLGCWKITGKYKGAELSFVVWVTP